jgi:hypothetical protein
MSDFDLFFCYGGGFLDFLPSWIMLWIIGPVTVVVSIWLCYLAFFKGKNG